MSIPVYQVIVLGIVQGLTEWLPISSTAHLILFPWLAGWSDPGLAFDVALHTGTLLAAVSYFWSDWVAFLRATLPTASVSSGNSLEMQSRRRLLGLIVIGTAPAAVAGVAGHRYVEEQLRSIPLIAASMIVVGLLMAWAERRSSYRRNVEVLQVNDAVAIGVAQACALIPGVSRSGATITAALWRDMNRQAAARFSFLLATPVIAGAALVEVPRLLHAVRLGTEVVSLPTILLGVAVSAVSGYLAIAAFLRYLQFRTLMPFVYYRVALGSGILVLWFLQHAAAR
jgi:undecaprenyl-diphosphatase